MKKCVLSVILCLFASVLWADQYITTRDVKVRADRNIHAGVVGTLAKNTTVEVTETGNTWLKVTYNGHDGYVQKTYLKHAAGTNVGKPIEENEGFDTNSIFILIGLVLAIILVVKGSMSYSHAKKMRERYKDKAAPVAEVGHWYQCKHCKISIRNGTEPRLAGCTKSMQHHWMHLGQIGEHKYICKNCSIIVTVKAEPALHGCASGDTHHWRKF